MNAKAEKTARKSPEFEKLIAEAAGLTGEGSQIVVAIRALPAGPHRVRSARALVAGLRQREQVPTEKSAAKKTRTRSAHKPKATSEPAMIEALNHAPVQEIVPVPEPQGVPVEDIPQEAPADLSDRETAVIRKLYPQPAGLTIARKSEREFDLAVNGAGFRAWVPLAVIYAIDWTVQAIAEMTDYPEMTASGDWSGVRDSSKGAKWMIFEAVIDGFMAGVSGWAKPKARAKRPAKDVTKKVAARQAKPEKSAAPKSTGASILGYQASSLIRWMAQQRWSFPQILAVVSAQGCPMGKRSVYHRFLEGNPERARGGKAGVSRPKAQPTPQDAERLEALRLKLA